MIPKADMYVYDTIKYYINKVVSTIGTDDESYIIREAIGNTEIGGDTSVEDTFMKAFSGNNKQEIQFSYAFPTQKENLDAMYVIMRGSGKESTDSIGSIVGEHNDSKPAVKENSQVDSCVVLKDDDGYYFELTQPIDDLVSISEVASDTFVDRERDDPDVKRVNLTDEAADYLGETFTVNYHVADEGYKSNYGGVDVGAVFTEKVMVQAISNNVDTARCLDSILKYVLLIMRKSFRENNYYQLANIESQGEQLLDTKLDRPIYAFPTVITYQNTYSVSMDSSERFKEIILKDRNKYGEN